MFWCVLVYSGAFWCVLVCSGVFWCILVHSGVFCPPGPQLRSTLVGSPQTREFCVGAAAGWEDGRTVSEPGREAVVT